jgi:hypothetical protein
LGLDQPFTTGGFSMRTIALLAVSLLCVSVWAAEPAPPAEQNEGFVPLFDGQTFEGWKTSDSTPQSWKIDNGLLQLTGGSSHLVTAKVYEDFVVRFEWRPVKKGYNSGFFVRGSQIQMAQGGAGMLFGNKATKAVPELHHPPGEWNAWEVTCIGTKLTLKVNGTLAWEIDDFKPRKGPLGIEAEGHAIDFRNLRVKEVQAEGKP